MGTSTSWIAAHGATLDELASRLDLERSSDSSSGDAIAYEAVILANGWIIFVHRMVENGVVAQPKLLADLSREWRVVGCDEESHVMYSAASEWLDGRETWAAFHSSEEAADHFELRGAPPPESNGVRDEFLAKHAAASAAGENVDYVYEIPLVLAHRAVGFRVDVIENDDLDFVALKARSRPASPSGRSKPWWKVW